MIAGGDMEPDHVAQGRSPNKITVAPNAPELFLANNIRKNK
jgi:hypothetical protein